MYCWQITLQHSVANDIPKTQKDWKMPTNVTQSHGKRRMQGLFWQFLPEVPCPVAVTLTLPPRSALSGVSSLSNSAVNLPVTTCPAPTTTGEPVHLFINVLIQRKSNLNELELNESLLVTSKTRVLDGLSETPWQLRLDKLANVGERGALHHGASSRWTWRRENFNEYVIKRKKLCDKKSAVSAGVSNALSCLWPVVIPITWGETLPALLQTDVASSFDLYTKQTFPYLKRTAKFRR